MENTSDGTIKLVNVPVYSTADSCHSAILLPPGSRCFYAASKFSVEDRPSAVYVYVNGVKQASHLQPYWFQHLVKISFHVDGDGGLTVKGVKARLSDYLRFWRRNLQRDYVGRTEVVIIQQRKSPPIAAV